MSTRYFITFLFTAVCFIGGKAQTLTLEEAYKLARENYPLLKQKSLIERTGDYSLENIAKGTLPQISVNGQATYQSEVTQIPIKLPYQELPMLSKDQYRIYAEAVQPLTDLITIKKQQEYQKTTLENANDNLEVELYKLKERINNLYFGILLIDEQRKLSALTKDDIQTGINKVTAAVKDGTDFKSSLDKLNAESLKIDQRDIELISNRRSFLDMLSLFTGRKMSDTTKLDIPIGTAVAGDISRPELKAFESQQRTFDAQMQLLHTKTLPKFSLFLQAGVGRPGLDMLKNDFSPFYIGGLKLNWPLSNFYTYKKEVKIIGLNKEMITVQKENFLFNINLSLQQQTEDVRKFEQLLDVDRKILVLRTSVKNTAIAQLENGVITVNDYLKEVLNEENARQQVSLHTLQLIQAQYAVKTTTGN